MRIIELHQSERELGNGEIVFFKSYIINATFADNVGGVMVSMTFADSTKAQSDRRYNMLQALAEFDGGEGIEINPDDDNEEPFDMSDYWPDM